MTLCSSYLNLFSLYLANFEYISSQSYFFFPRTDFWSTAVQIMPALTWKEKTKWTTLQTLWEDLNFCPLHHPVNSDPNYNCRYFSNITRGGCPLHRLSQGLVGGTGFKTGNWRQAKSARGGWWEQANFASVCGRGRLVVMWSSWRVHSVIVTCWRRLTFRQPVR